MKIFSIAVVVLLMLSLLLIPISSVYAGGGQVQGEKGQGSTHENFENGCDTQPCFDIAERPQIGKP